MFISEVAGGEHSLDVAAGKAYTKSLRRYHNWIVRGIFSVSRPYPSCTHREGFNPILWCGWEVLVYITLNTSASLLFTGCSEGGALPQGFPGSVGL